MTATIGIFGASGFAREVGDIVHALGKQAVYIARDRAEADLWPFDADILVESDIDSTSIEAFAIGIGDNVIRQKVASRYVGKLRFPSLLHPSATFGYRQREQVEAAQGVIVCAGARLSNNIKVGNFSTINPNATIGHDVVLEDFVNIAPAACISGNVYLETGCWIGAGATINQGNNDLKLRVGHHCVVGSGAVVVKPCDAGGIYAGVPARRIK